MVRTLLDRRRMLPDINSKDRGKRKKSERKAINTPIQGTASDIMKLAMIEINKSLLALQNQVFPPAESDSEREVRWNEAASPPMLGSLILNVHDELIYLAHQDYKDKIIDIIRFHMEQAVRLSIAIPVR